jgi:PAS domain S-box-containing protein
VLSDSTNNPETASLLLASIVSSADDAIVSKTLEGTITSWNPAAEAIFGYSADEIVGRPIYVIIPPELAGEEVEILRRIGRGERIAHFETERLRKNGSRVQVSVTISPLIKDGRVIGASKIARDITERKSMERDLADAGVIKSGWLVP